jgi:hypothetical protein
MTLVTTKFKSGGLHEKHVVATWKVGNHLNLKSAEIMEINIAKIRIYDKWQIKALL